MVGYLDDVLDAKLSRSRHDLNTQRGKEGGEGRREEREGGRRGREEERWKRERQKEGREGELRRFWC